MEYPFKNEINIPANTEFNQMIAIFVFLIFYTLLIVLILRKSKTYYNNVSKLPFEANEI